MSRGSVRTIEQSMSSGRVGIEHSMSDVSSILVLHTCTRNGDKTLSKQNNKAKKKHNTLHGDNLLSVRMQLAVCWSLGWALVSAVLATCFPANENTQIGKIAETQNRTPLFSRRRKYAPADFHKLEREPDT